MIRLKGKGLDRAQYFTLRCAPVMMVCSVLLVLAATLFPYEFFREPRTKSINRLLPFFANEIEARGTDLVIGSDASAGQFFRGSIDDLRIYRRALSQVEVQTDLMTSVSSMSRAVPGLVAAYSFDEGSGSRIEDWAGLGSSGRTINGPTWTEGKRGGALSFDGRDDQIIVPNSTSIDIAGRELTFSLWVNIVDTHDGVDGVILAKPWSSGAMGDPPYQYGLEFDANGDKSIDFYFGDNAGRGRGPFSMSVPLGVWTHIAITYDGAKVNGYVDGSRVLSGRISELPDVGDCLANIILFLPFGAALSAITQSRGRRSVILFVCASAAVLSFIVECLQALLPTRNSSIADILCNTLGAGLGAAVFGARSATLGELAACYVGRARSKLSKRGVAACVAGWAALAFGMTVYLQRNATLSNWEDTFVLSLGNDPTGNREWRGHVRQMEVADTSVSEEQVHQVIHEGLEAIEGKNWMVSYLFSDSQKLDVEWPGDFPGFSLQRRTPSDSGVQAAGPDSTTWLQAVRPVSDLVQRIKQTNRFTFNITCVPENTMQRGPARILSVSRSPDDVNIGIGQAGTDLVVQVRTEVTGKSGNRPELVVPQVFTSTMSRNLLITFDGSELRVYVDGSRQRYSLFLGPGAALFKNFFPLKLQEMKGYDVVYYCIVFAPFGLLLALMFDTWNRSRIARVLVIGTISLLLVASVEFMSTHVRGGTLLAAHLLVGSLAATGSALLGHWVISSCVGYGVGTHAARETLPMTRC